MNIELVDLDTLLATSDFVTIHVAKTPETIGLINAERLAKAKQGIRIINVARGGIVVESDLADAIRSGHVGGAALDVFDEEPTTESPLFELAGGRGHAAPRGQHPRGPGQGGRHHRRDGRARPRRRVRAVRGERERGGGQRDGAARSCRSPSASARCSAGWPARSTSLEIDYEGEIGGYDTRILTLSLLKGFFGRISDEPVSYVNAPKMAEERGIERHRERHDHVPPLREPDHGAGRRPHPRGHARRAGRRGPPGHRRRPPRRRAAGQPHARRPQRRPPRDDRHRSAPSSARPA